MTLDKILFSGEITKLKKVSGSYFAIVSSENKEIRIPISKEIYDKYLPDVKRCQDDRDNEVRLNGALTIKTGVRYPF